MARVLLLVMVVGGFLSGVVRGQVNPFNPPPTPPEQEEARKYKELRYDEDWTFLRPSRKQLAWWDPFKFVPLDDAGNSYLTLGGEIRERFEYFKNPLRIGPVERHEGSLLERYMLLADLHVGPVRVFGQVASGEVVGERNVRGTDLDRLDLRQLFVDVGAPVGTGTLTLRVGRQEMAYGAERMISVRDWANVRLSFDAVRVLMHAGEWEVDGFVGRPVEVRVGNFDDASGDGANFWGVYATGPVGVVKGMAVDFYYLGLERAAARFAEGAGDESRHTAGARLSGKAGGWDYDGEGAVQWGKFGGERIAAWSAMGEAGYTFEEVMLMPRVGLRAEVSSGDKKAGDGRLGTFEPLFPKAGYFDESAMLGPGNLMEVGPTLKLKLPKRVTVTAGWDFFWRTSTGDGVYDELQNVLRGGGGDQRFVGQQGRIGVVWEVPRHLRFSVGYSHLFAGGFLRGGGHGGGDVDYVGAQMRYQF